MSQVQSKVKKRKLAKRFHGQSALSLIEEAIGVLRAAPLLLLAYTTGSLPFMLALLYFWSDMIRSPFAARHVAETSLGLALLFLWMKSWHAVFIQQVLAYIRHIPPPQWHLVRIWRLVITQTILHSWGILALPVALLLTAPFPWLYAWYQNISVYGHGEESHTGTVMKQAWQQAKLWPKQNMIVIWLISPWLLMVAAVLLVVGLPLLGTLENGGWLVVLLVLLVLLSIPLNPIGMVIALNLAGAIMMLPWLAKTLFGIEPVFTLSSMSALNSTFVVIVYALAYLCLDPLVKTVYALRCFYGESIHTGEDLKVALRALKQNAVVMVCTVGAACWMGVSAPTLAAELLELTLRPPLLEREGEQELWQHSPLLSLSFQERGTGGEFLWAWQSFLTIPVLAQETVGEARVNPDTSSAPVLAQELEASLRHVLNQTEYSWRLPRERVSLEDQEERQWHPALQWIADAIDGIGETLKRWGKTIKRWGKAIGDWWDRLFPDREHGRQRSQHRTDWMPGVQALVFILLAAIVSVLGVLLWRFFKQRQNQEKTVMTVEVAAKPDLTNDDVDARELPEDGWLAMARDLLEKGQVRLALRALYLATLACLAEQELITIARFKSDRDYERELQRRAHALPGIFVAFVENRLVFECIWYGMHEATAQNVETFKANYTDIKQSLSR